MVRCTHQVKVHIHTYNCAHTPDAVREALIVSCCFELAHPKIGVHMIHTMRSRSAGSCEGFHSCVLCHVPPLEDNCANQLIRARSVKTGSFTARIRFLGQHGSHRGEAVRTPFLQHFDAQHVFRYVLRHVSCMESRHMSLVSAI